MSDDSLARVAEYWEAASCGEELYLGGEALADYDRQAAERYRLEPSILGFAQFERYRGRRVLEVGVGLGADHERFAMAGADLSGIDLTERAVDHVRRRFALRGLESELRVGNAEQLSFADDTFDLVYSWGVLHHTPDTRRAVAEVLRVLKPGGEARIMVYHKHSLVGYMLWLRYGLARGRPRTPLVEIYARHLESPGTKAYTVDQARQLCAGFEIDGIETELTHADLLSSAAGQRHGGRTLALARRFWPRGLIRALCPRRGLFLKIRARKPTPSARG